MMHKALALGFTLLVSCKSKTTDKPIDKVPEPVSATDASTPPTAGDPPKPMPKAKRGLLAYTKTSYAKDGTPAPQFLWLVDPDGGTPINTSIEFNHEVDGGHHLLSGSNDSGRWLLDLRSPNLVARPHASDVQFVTPDDRLVWRCSGGLAKPFEICISDADGSNKKVLLSEPVGAGSDDPGIVTAAGRAVVHGSYAGAAAKYVRPPFSISIADGTRTNYPALGDPSKAGANDGSRINPFYSPSGNKAVTCTERLTVTTLDGSVKPRTFPIPGGLPTRCMCRISNDENLLACSILQQKQRTEDLEVWNLTTGVKTLIAKNISIEEFLIAPDATELAWVTNVDSGEEETELKITSVDGKSTRIVDKLEKGKRLFSLYAWTDPN